MAFAATRGSQQDGLVDQGVLVNEVEEVLEQARVGAAEDRGCHHQDVSLLDRDKRLLHGVGQVGAPDRASKVRCQLTQFDQALFARDVVCNQVQQVLCQSCGFGGALQSAGDCY
ncbi:hypothetical protein D3C71_795940 [compost metagenome]